MVVIPSGTVVICVTVASVGLKVSRRTTVVAALVLVGLIGIAAVVSFTSEDGTVVCILTLTTVDESEVMRASDVVLLRV